jgi:RNA 3'-phosphate cyclase
MVHPVKKLRSIQLVERGEVKSIKGISLVGSLPIHIARRQAEAAKQKLKRAGFEAEIEVKVVDTLSPGTCIVLWAETEHSILGADALGERGLPAERVGRGAAKDLLNSINSGAALDLHMADQILPFLSLANSYSTVSVEKITYHCLTNMQVIEKLLPVRFEVKGEKGAKGQISIKGINFENELLA